MVTTVVTNDKVDVSSPKITRRDRLATLRVRKRTSEEVDMVKATRCSAREEAFFSLSYSNSPHCRCFPFFSCCSSAKSSSTYACLFNRRTLFTHFEVKFRHSRPEFLHNGAPRRELAAQAVQSVTPKVWVEGRGELMIHGRHFEGMEGRVECPKHHRALLLTTRSGVVLARLHDVD